MALDGALLSQIRFEIEKTSLGVRVEKIYQPSREEIALVLRAKGDGGRLLISAGANTPRIHFTKMSLENPKAPPMFCMLLRKHLNSAKLIEVKQIGMDRTLHLIFDTINELGDHVPITIAVEIMGRHSNIILIDHQNKIIDSIKRIDLEMSSVRPVLPGMQYTLPPEQDKINLLDTTAEQVIAALHRVERDINLSKRLMEILQGVAPILCREIAFFATKGSDKIISELTAEDLDRLKFYLETLIHKLLTDTGTPTMQLEKSGKPKDFTFLPIEQYGDEIRNKTYGNYSEMLDSFYGERDAVDRMRQRSNDLLKLLTNISDRITRKLASQREELKECANREQLKIYGELLSVNLFAIQKGDREAIVTNYYEESMPEIKIPLDIMLTPVQNSQKYYSEYRKADTAEKKLIELIKNGEEELRYIEAVFDLLTRARTDGELLAIRAELAEGGYVKKYAAKNKKEEKLAPLKYLSTDGFTILCGRNNVQNDKLTLKDSRNYDIWFHTQKIPGSHTVILTEGKDVPNTTLEQAAIIAAYNSKARDSVKVPVDYTIIKYVKKPNGAKPGMVIYENFTTAIVDPNAELVASLFVK